MRQFEDIPPEKRPILKHHGEGVWSVEYHFHTAAEALALFREVHRGLKIAAMAIESRTPTLGVITLIAEAKKSFF